MRLFPRALRRAVPRLSSGRAGVAVLATTGLLVGAASLPQAVAENLDDKKEQVEKKIDKANDLLEESNAEVQAATTALLQARADLANAQAYLAQTQGELAAARALDAQMQAKLEAAVARLHRARAELASGRADVAEQERQLREMVVAAYEQGDPSLMGLSVLFTTQDPAELTGSLNASDTVMNVETATLDQLEAARVLLEVKEQEMQAAKEDVALKRQEAAENLARKQALEEQAREAAAQVAQLVSLRQQAHANALRAKKSDLSALAKLQAERDRIEALIAAQASRGSGYTGGGAGFLDYPVDGYVTSPYGWRTHPIWGYRSLHDGVDFGAACGTPIRASADGVVLSEYYQTAWGNRIIIDHGVRSGVGVATISNHLSGYAVSEGERVERGQIVGYVGSTGWSTGCHLHFTVMENGVPVDPMKWF